MKIVSVVGARPNFMKIAPFIRSIIQSNENKVSEKIKHVLVHTGQHYDVRMSESFFESLEIPRPDINLEIGSGSQAEQVGYTMIAFEKVLEEEKPDWVVLVGDVNATLACTIAAKKMHIKVCHIEAGLRSGDERMPEEINRLVTDRLSDLLLTTDKHSIHNLLREGVPEQKIRFVGNIMIDTLQASRVKASRLDIEQIIQNNLIDGQSFSPIGKFREDIILNIKEHFTLMTLHRPSNIDYRDELIPLFNFLVDEVANTTYLIWPIHPRAEKMLKKFGLWGKALKTKKLILLHPIDYHEMLRLNMGAAIMLTDSGGLQEECCVLGTPCLTLRWTTERPVTLRKHGGVSVLVGNNVDRIRDEYTKTLKLDRAPYCPELWDGKTAVRCLEALLEYDIDKT